MKILMIEDNYSDVEAIRTYFSHTEYDFFHTDTLRAAVEEYNTSDIAVILLDLYLPDSRGLDTLLKLKSSFKNVPIIILTEVKDSDLAHRALNFGAQDYIEKQDVSRANIERIIRYAIERNRNMKEMEDMNQRLIELNARKTEFLGIASHDIRTPVSTIYTLSEMMSSELEKDPVNKEKIARAIELINSSSRKIMDLVNFFLDISRIESEDILLERTPVDYIQLVREVIAMLNDIAVKKGITIHFEPAIDSFMITIDPSRIEQVLSNIISNGIKYSREKSDIIIKVYEKSNYLITTINDNGIGIPENKLSDIFHPYKRAGLPTAGEKSTGLGLTIAKKIIKAHDGEIGVSSIVDKGSTFYFSLPIL